METKDKNTSRARTICRRAGVATVVAVGALAVPSGAAMAAPPTLPPANFDAMGDEITTGAGNMIGFMNTKYVPALAAVMAAGLAITVGRKLYRRLSGAT